MGWRIPARNPPLSTGRDRTDGMLYLVNRWDMLSILISRYFETLEVHNASFVFR